LSYIKGWAQQVWKEAQKRLNHFADRILQKEKLLSAKMELVVFSLKLKYVVSYNKDYFVTL